MAFSIKTLIPLAVLLLIASTAQSQSQTISFTYDFNGGPEPTDLIYQGDAHFPFDSTYLRLIKTDDNGNALTTSAGRAVHAEPIPLWQAGQVTDFETTVKFIIRPNANDNKPPADGLVFFMAPVGTTIPTGSTGGTFGVFGTNGNQSQVFAAEFDIYVNPEWDPSHRHVGIDLQSARSVATSPVPDDLVGRDVTMRVNYVGSTRMISVVVTTDSGEIYEVNHQFDLSNILPQQVQVGLAASTGANVAIHDVISWYFTATTLLERRGYRKSIRQIV